MSQTNQEKIWQKHAKEDNSSTAANEAMLDLSKLDTAEINPEEKNKKHAESSRSALVLSKSAALKTDSEKASKHLRNAIQVLLKHYPVGAEEKEAIKKSKDWDGTLVENQSAQLICLRDMLSLLEFVSKVAPSEEISNLTNNVLVILLEMSEEKSSEIFALISLTERADYERAVEAFKLYTELYCFPERKVQLDQIITVSTRFLERTIEEKSPKDALLALENIFRTFIEDQSWTKRIALDMVKAIFPSLKDKIINEAAIKIRNEINGKDELQEGISKLIKLTFVGLGDGKVENFSNSS